MSMWPFLLARGFSVGHRAVMTPPILLGEDARGWLAEAIERPPDRVVETWSLYRSAERNLTLCFRRLPAGPEYVDESSRPVSITEGIVVEGLTNEIPSEPARAECHRVAQAVFGAFWEADNRFLPTISAPELDGRRLDTATLVSVFRPAPIVPPRPQPQPPLVDTPKPRRWSCVVVLGLALMLVVVVIVVAST